MIRRATRTPRRITTSLDTSRSDVSSLTLELERLRKENAALMEDNKQLRAAMTLFQHALARGEAGPDCG